MEEIRKPIYSNLIDLTTFKPKENLKYLNNAQYAEFKAEKDRYDELDPVAARLNIYPINIDYNLNDATTTNLRPKTNNLLNINLTDNKQGIQNIKIGTNVSMNNANNLPLVCDRVYPLYLATKDVELSKNNSKLDQNTLRCAYSKICARRLAISLASASSS